MIVFVYNKLYRKMQEIIPDVTSIEFDDDVVVITQHGNIVHQFTRDTVEVFART